ncbi:MAG TPA: acylneuraminate cytidylyltransferase family protein [Burkholderiales bacterium]|nr:acylneuraminate cytidylyltransferase family protein [Burkholderiales bacterium]
MLKNWCIIPARGGSKALPRKNVAALANEPLISFTIRAALSAVSVHRVIVTTDDEEIAAVSRRYGAEAPFLRPAELAQDQSPTLPAIQHAVSTMEKLTSDRPDVVTLIQPTSPFTRFDQVDAAVTLLNGRADADAVTTVVDVDHVNHPYNVRRIDADGFVDFFMPKEHYQFLTRQSKPTFYRFGNLYVTRYNTLMQENSLFGKRCLPLPIDLASCFDINDAYDLAIANAMVDSGAIKLSSLFSNERRA